MAATGAYTLAEPSSLKKLASNRARRPMTLKTLCKPRASVFAADRRATVLSLDTFLKGRVHGSEFFDENYFTSGMTILVERAFSHLSGAGAGSSVFLLSQAMGGGKTHSMIGLGLLARDPELRHRVLGRHDPAPKLGPCCVVGFNGRSTSAPAQTPHSRIRATSSLMHRRCRKKFS